MCLNCGCGDPTRRQRPTDITLADLRRAADGSYRPLGSVLASMQVSLSELEAKESGIAPRTTEATRPTEAVSRGRA